MESYRLPLFAVLGVLIFFTWQQWTKEVDQANKQNAALIEEFNQEQTETPVPVSAGETELPAEGVVQKARHIIVESDVLRVMIDTQGGSLIAAELLNYPKAKDEPNNKVRLLNNDEAGHFFIIQNGLASTNKACADHKASFVTEKDRYLISEQDQSVQLRWVGENGTRVEKTFSFEPGSYQIDLTQTIVNQSGESIECRPYVRLWRNQSGDGSQTPFIQAFTGAAIYEKDGEEFKFRKYDFDDAAEDKIRIEQTGGWTSMLQHYFAVGVFPPDNETLQFTFRPGKTRGFINEYAGQTYQVADGEQQSLVTKLYVGPKLQHVIGDIAPGFGLTIDYGILTFFSELLFVVLDFFHDLTNNWGWSIIILTACVKVAFYWLSEKQYRSMAKMKKFAPRIQAIKERYGEDRQQMQQAMMELYTKEGFNPLAGCWPILVQMPIFISLYWVLLESVELRQADFAFWLNDLSSPDPYFVLPILFGASMYFQQKLSGTQMTMDPMQQKIMNIMPLMLTAFFAFFPSGLVLYWVVNNLLSMAQQWYIYRKMDREGLR